MRADPAGRHGDGTRCVTAGLPDGRRGAPFLPGPTLASTYHLDGPGDGGADAGDTYGRSDNPTWRRYEEALADLEGGGEAVVFASGIAAVGAVLWTALRPGDTVVIPGDGYYLSRVLARERVAPGGVTVREIPAAHTPDAVDVAGARLVVLETPSNPWLDVCDIAAAADVAHRHGALVAVDNTTATPLGQRPLDLGADVSFGSDSKAVTGHADLLLGHVAVREPALAAGLRSWRTQTGAVAGPFEVWLAHRSLATLDLRLARQAANGLALARALRACPAVSGVRHPALPDDPSYPLASAQMRRHSGLVAFTLPSAAAVGAFLAGSRLVHAATSFGGVHTTADRRAQWRGDDVPEGFVRLSAGCEDTADLVDDVLSALDGRSGEGGARG